MDGKSRSNRVPHSIFLLWVIGALAVSTSGLLLKASPLQVAAIVWGLVLAVIAGIAVAPPIRAFAMKISLHRLIAWHLTRFVGIYFIVLYEQGKLPYSFGLQGGIGDILAALGAVALLLITRYAKRPVASKWILLWNVFGLVDILYVVASALRDGLRDYDAMAPIRQFPLNLLPLLVVPLILVSHGLIFIRWKRELPLKPSHA